MTLGKSAVKRGVWRRWNAQGTEEKLRTLEKLEKKPPKNPQKKH